MRANKKTIVLLAVVTAALTGCAVTEEYDLYEITNTAKTIFLEEVLNTSLPYARTVKSCAAELPQNQTVVAREYGEYSVVHFPEEYAGTDYCFPYAEDIANAYHVTKFEGAAGAPIEFEWIGSIELGRELHEIAELEHANYIELADSSDMARLFAMSQAYENNSLDSPEDIVWNLCIDTDVVVVRDGLCEISEQDKGYHVLLDVESKTRKGYASVFVDTSVDTMTYFVYTEALEQYDDERTRTFIDNLQLSDGVITQIKDIIQVELGTIMDFVPAEYFEANPWELLQCEVDKKLNKWIKVGNYTADITLLDQTYPLQIEVRDTTPPEVILPDLSGVVLEGERLVLSEYSMDIEEISKPVKIYIKDISDDCVVTEELCDEEGYINFTVCVQDTSGNITEKNTKFLFVENNEQNTWMQKIGIEPGRYWEDISFFLGDAELMEMMYGDPPTYASLEELVEWNDEFWGWNTAKKGLQIAESGIVDIRYESEDTDNMKAFYEGLAYVPENVLQEYEQRGWYLKVIDEELDNWITGGEAAGLTSYSDKRIRYTTAANQGARTIPHEFGHFVDYILGMKSESASFQEIYNERKNSSKVVKKKNAWHDYDTDNI